MDLEVSLKNKQASVEREIEHEYFFINSSVFLCFPKNTGT